MKQLIAFFSTFIVIMMVGILVLANKNAIKDGFGSAFDTVVASAKTSEQSGGKSQSASAGDSKSKVSSDSAGSAGVSDSAASSEGTETIKREYKGNPITRTVVSKVMDSYANSSDGEAKAVYDSMSEADRALVTDIIAENIALDKLPEIQTMLEKHDSDAIMEYAEKNLSKEDQTILIGIMNKYAD